LHKGRFLRRVFSFARSIFAPFSFVNSHFGNILIFYLSENEIYALILEYFWIFFIFLLEMGAKNFFNPFQN